MLSYASDMWKGKVVLQEQARKLRTQGKSVKEIARKLNVAKSSVSAWVRGVILTSEQMLHLKQRELNGALIGRKGAIAYWEAYRKLHPRKIKVGPRWPVRTVENFFDVWTPEMAYILGYFAADGCMYKNKRGSCYVGFVSTDKALIISTKKLMGVTNTIEEYQCAHPQHKRRYTLQIGSRKLFSQLLVLGFTPHKSRTLRLPKIPKQFLSHFVRGNLDGDGCVHVGNYKRKNSKNIRRVFSVCFTSGSLLFLQALRRQLSTVANIGQGSLREKVLAWDLTYGQRDARQLYSFLYPTSTVPYLARKKLKFEQGLSLVKSQGPVV